jgi:NAD(P)-dependent dehydrogenase (short-subunit alcohol dehydrogenase family)
LPTALVIGASRGLGFETARQYLADGWRVLGSHRSEEDRVKLREAGAETYRIDVLDDKDLAAFAWQIDDESVDVVVLNAGVYGPRDSSLNNAPSREDFDEVMQTNVLAPLKLLPVLSPLVLKSRGTLALLSSRMGSISSVAGNYGLLYRASKSAVNLVGRLAHTELSPRGARVLLLHPGWVRTDMGGPNADVEVTDSVSGLRRVIADRAQYPSGGFYDYRGQSIAW